MPHTTSPYLVTNASRTRHSADQARHWPALEARAALAMFRVTETLAYLHASLAAAHQLGREALQAGAEDQGDLDLGSPGALISSEPLLLAHWCEGAVQALTEQLVHSGRLDPTGARRCAAAVIAKHCPAPRTTGTAAGDIALADWWPRPVFERGPCRPRSERWMEFASDIDFCDGDGLDHGHDPDCQDPDCACHGLI